MDKALLILTGGTIGSTTVDGTIDVSPEAAHKIVDMYYKKYGKDMDFDVIQPVNTLSENMSSAKWLDICKCIDEKFNDTYKGIIICHGSDSLAYTSPLIGMIYCRLKAPVVLIASNYELEHEKSNGLVNLKSAVTIVKTGIKGVFATYSNNRGENDVYIATRIMESEPFNDQYRSFEGSPWGVVTEKGLEIKHPPYADELNSHETEFKIYPKDFNKKVMLIRPYPNLNYNDISIDNVSAVLHYTYHGGTACTEGRGRSLINFAHRCKENGVKLYLASFKDKNFQEAYQTSRDILEAGVIPMFNISYEAAYVKAVLCENVEGLNIDHNLFFESVDK